MALDALTPDERRDLLISIGTHKGRRTLSPVEVASLLKKERDSGTNLAELAKAVQLESTTQVTRFLSLLRLPPEHLHLIDWGRSDAPLPFTAAFEISRLGEARDQGRTIEATLEYRLTAAEVRQIVQARKRSDKQIDECIALILKMRPQVEVRHVFIGAVLREDVRTQLSLMSQQRRDALLQGILDRTFADLRARGRLGTERFTLVGGDELGAAAQSRKEKLEKEINVRLGAEIGA